MKTIPAYYMRAITLSLCLMIFTMSNAQQWQWGKSYSGSDGPSSNDQWNEIRNTAFDREGNIYIFGRFGPNAKIDGENILSYYDLTMGAFLAKLSPEGDLIWHKPIKCKQGELHPFWMELVGDSVVSISGSLYIPNTPGYVYFMDTVVWYSQIEAIPDSMRRLPFIPDNYNYFLTFDLDGNLLDEHYLQVQDRDSTGSGRRRPFVLSYLGYIAPFHVDRAGNTYFFTRYSYSGEESAPVTVIVDRERYYDFYLPGSTPSSNEAIQNAMIYKFSPGWELVWAKPVFTGDSGLLLPGEAGFSDSTGHYIYPRIGGLSYDSEDNMYLSGTILGYPLLGRENPNTYPAYLHLDSTHSIEFRDGGSLLAQSFVIKYDTSGSVQWVNQLYQHCPPGEQALNRYSSHYFAGNTFNESNQSVCISGHAYNYPASRIYFDNGTNLAQHSEENITRAFFARFDRETGHYLTHGIFPASTQSSINTSCHSPACINNQVFATVTFSGTAYDTDTIYTDPFFRRMVLVTRWHESGAFIDMFPIYTPTATYFTNPGLTILNEEGELFVTGQFDGNIIFGDITVYGGGSHSNAFYAKYYDPSFSVPYVGIKENALPVRLLFYPNPTDGMLRIIIPEGEKIEGWILYQINGKKIEEGRDTSLDLRYLAKGCYILRVNTDTRNYSEKVVLY